MSGENLGTLLALASGERAEVALSDGDQLIEQAAKRARTAEEPSNSAGFTEEEDRSRIIQNSIESHPVPPYSFTRPYKALSASWCVLDCLSMSQYVSICLNMSQIVSVHLQS